MASATISPVLQHIHRIAGVVSCKQQTDRQLLEQFAEHQEQSAFAALVQRHGPMVFGVCRRVLGHVQDAEDVFQATFLVLAKKASSMSWQESVANWLYSVAYRLSLKLRSANHRRQAQTLSTAEEVSHEDTAAAQWRELKAVLDQELLKLPDEFRTPLVLCYLEGKTRDEAAQQLGWTMHMVKGRLERARNLLRDGLTRRGLGLSVALLPAALCENTACALSASLLTETSVAAVETAAGHTLSVSLPTQVMALTKGALHTMFWTKMNWIAGAVLFIALLGSGAGWIAHQAWADHDVVANSRTAAANNPQVSFTSTLAVGQREGQEGERPKKKGDGERPKKEGEGDGEPGTRVNAKLKELDLKKGTVTVTIHRDGEEPHDKTYSLAGKDIRIISNRETPVSVKDLKAGTRVTLILSPVNDVKGIRVQGTPKREGKVERDGEQRTVTGEMIKLDKKKRTILLLQRRDNGNFKLEFNLAKDVKVAFGEDKQGDLDDLKPGARVIGKLGEDKKTIVAIRAIRQNQRKIAAYGFIKNIDVKKRVLILTIKREGGVVDEKNYAVAKELRIMIPRKEGGKLSDVKEGNRVMLQLSPDRETVIGIRVYPGDGDRKGDGDREKD